MEIFVVKLSRRAEKQIQRLPSHIILKLASWIEGVGNCGLSEMRKIPGYHDEPLLGKRKGERSIRLSKQYRAIYVVIEGTFYMVEIQEVNKHEY